MIKKHIIRTLFVVLFAAGLLAPAYAATPTTATPTATPTEETSPVDSTVKSLKEKIENKVKELNKSTKKIIKGTVESVNDGTIVIASPDAKKYTITIDDTITTIYTATLGELEEANATDVKKGLNILVQGPEIEGQVTANVIYIQPEYLVLSGQITSTDKDAFTISIITQTKDEYTLDIEKGTRQFLMNSKDLTLAKAGFSKYRIGDTIHCVIEKPDEGAKTVSAMRTVIIPQEYFSEDLTPTKASE